MTPSEIRALELAILPLLMLSPAMVANDGSPRSRIICDSLVKAAGEPLSKGLLKFKARKLITPVTQTVLGPYDTKTASAGELMLAVYYLTCRLTHSGYLVMWSGSAAHTAYDLLWDFLAPLAADPAADAKAEQIAAEMLKVLQGLGLFEGES